MQNGGTAHCLPKFVKTNICKVLKNKPKSIFIFALFLKYDNKMSNIFSSKRIFRFGIQFKRAMQFYFFNMTDECHIYVL